MNSSLCHQSGLVAVLDLRLLRPTTQAPARFQTGRCPRPPARAVPPLLPVLLRGPPRAQAGGAGPGPAWRGRLRGRSRPGGSGLLISTLRVARREQTAASPATGAGVRPTPPTSSACLLLLPSLLPPPPRCARWSRPLPASFSRSRSLVCLAYTSPCCTPGDPSILRSNLRDQWCSKSLEKAALGRDSGSPSPFPLSGLSPCRASSTFSLLLAPFGRTGWEGEVERTAEQRGPISELKFHFHWSKAQKIRFFKFCNFFLFNFFLKETYFGGVCSGHLLCPVVEKWTRLVMVLLSLWLIAAALVQVRTSADGQVSGK